MSDIYHVPPSDMPARIGPYVILEEIGAGGMGTVYLGRHSGTQQVAAIKVLPPAMAREEGFRLRFAREIEAMQLVNSPNIVQLYSSGEDVGSVYYAMEYVAGETLAQRLRRERRLPWRDTLDVARQLCVALKAAHDAGVVHRDIKPSNILISTNGDVKLTDFGIAQLFAAEKLTLTGGVVGTAEYMSPEQAKGQRATRRSDLYSLGAVLYVMLTGRPPFVGQSSVDILHKHRFAQFDLPSRYVPEIPPALDEIVGQLLEKDPDKRMPDAFVLTRRLQQVQQADNIKLSEMPTTSDGEVRAGAAAARREGPGDATMMRDLVRSEVARQAAPSAWGRVLDNTWVLIGLMLTLVASVWWIATRGPTDEERFQAGEDLMQEEPGSDWLRARDEYFAPLMASDSETWEGRIRPYLDDIEVFELEQDLLSTRRSLRKRKEVPEIARQLQHVKRLWDDGQLPLAAEKLQAVRRLWAEDPDVRSALRIAEKWAEELELQTADWPDPTPWLMKRLHSADELQDSDPAAARQICQAVVELYAGDPRAESAVKRARQALDGIADDRAR